MISFATSEEVTTRTGDLNLVDPQGVGTMWRYFADLAEFERHAIDTPELAAGETVPELQKCLALGEFKLKPELDIQPGSLLK